MASKIEGKYFVRRLKEPLKEEQPKEEKIEELIEEPKPQAPLPKAPAYDPRIGVEILNQLKLLGEEMKHEGEKKEQKRIIKEVVHKQMNKPRYIYLYATTRAK